MIIYFDTETTGLRPGQICELSYIMQYENKLEAKNFFFSVDYVEPSAQRVHGFSTADLERLSNGKEFGSSIKEIQKDFEDAKLIVAHNFNFDFMFMSAEFKRYGEQFCFKNSLCSMKKFTPICKILSNNGISYKYPKLTELCDFLDIYAYDINILTKKLYNTYLNSHDSRYDTIALYLAMNEGAKKYDIISKAIEGNL